MDKIAGGLQKKRRGSSSAPQRGAAQKTTLAPAQKTLDRGWQEAADRAAASDQDALSQGRALHGGAWESNRRRH